MVWWWEDGHPRCTTVQADEKDGVMRLLPTRPGDKGAFMLAPFSHTPDPKDVPGYE